MNIGKASFYAGNFHKSAWAKQYHYVNTVIRKKIDDLSSRGFQHGRITQSEDRQINIISILSVILQKALPNIPLIIIHTVRLVQTGKIRRIKYWLNMYHKYYNIYIFRIAMSWSIAPDIYFQKN